MQWEVNYREPVFWELLYFKWLRLLETRFSKQHERCFYIIYRVYSFGLKSAFGELMLLEDSAGLRHSPRSAANSLTFCFILFLTMCHYIILIISASWRKCMLSVLYQPQWFSCLKWKPTFRERCTFVRNWHWALLAQQSVRVSWKRTNVFV